tara:strand:+ start:256 stop:507 length:252 start_codon:yes stop_codon:yes gene_type:complete
MSEELIDDYFIEYKKLGGKKTKKQYIKNLDIFFDETYDIFISGDTIKHNDRIEAAQAVIDQADISVKEFNLIFNSVDNITAYT